MVKNELSQSDSQEIKTGKPQIISLIRSYFPKLAIIRNFRIFSYDLALHEYKIRSRVQFQEDISWRVHRPYE